MVIGLLGFGTVGKGVYQVLSERSDVEFKYVVSLEKVELEGVKYTTDVQEILNDPEVDTVIELIGGLHPAFEFVSGALKAKKNVVTANKHMISEYYAELVKLARENGVCLRYSAAVGGGVPWLISLERAHRISRIYSLRGVMNGTTNFILDAMQERGASFEAALTEAQSLGFAEANPSADIDGLDASRKTTISSNVAFGVVVDGHEVDTFGIRSIRECDIKAASSHGRVCKLMGKGVRCGEKDEIAAWTEPCFLPANAPEAGVHEGNNLLSFDARFVGKESFFGPGAGGPQTGYAVAQDCLDVCNFHPGEYNREMRAVRLQNHLVLQSYYVRLQDSDSWLAERTEEVWESGVKTKPIPVSEMHAFARKMLAQGREIFFACIE